MMAVLASMLCTFSSKAQVPSVQFGPAPRAPAAHAPDVQAAQVAAIDDRIELAGPLDLARLVDLTAKHLDVVIEYDAPALKAQQLALRPTGALDR